MIEEIDWSVGEILAALKKHDLEQDTLVIFTSDNGPWLSYGNHAGTAGPLREGKGTTFDGGVRVPFVARWPGKIPAGSVCKVPAMTIDLLPTIAKFAGADLPKLPIDGKDIGSLLTSDAGAASPHDAYFFYWAQGLQAMHPANGSCISPTLMRASRIRARTASRAAWLRKRSSCRSSICTPTSAKARTWQLPIRRSLLASRPWPIGQGKIWETHRPSSPEPACGLPDWSRHQNERFLATRENIAIGRKTLESASPTEYHLWETCAVSSTQELDDMMSLLSRRLRRLERSPRARTATRKTHLNLDILEDREVPATGLGVANDFSAFILRNLTAFNSDIQGRVAVGGNANITAYAVGDRLSDSDGGRDDLIVGGNLNFTNGQVFFGNVVYGGTGTFDMFGHPNGSIRQAAALLDFNAATAELNALSHGYAALAQNGTVRNQFGTIILTGTNTGQNVFNVPASMLWDAFDLIIRTPAGSSALVNITGTDARMQFMGFHLEGVSKENVILNFPQATNLTFQGIGIFGNVLAPWAHVEFSNGQLNGTMVACSWSGYGQINYEPPPPPTPNHADARRCRPAARSAAWSTSTRTRTASPRTTSSDCRAFPSR